LKNAKKKILLLCGIASMLEVSLKQACHIFKDNFLSKEDCQAARLKSDPKYRFQAFADFIENSNNTQL